MERASCNFSRNAPLALLAALLGILPRLGAEPVWQTVPQKKDILPDPRGSASFLEKPDSYLIRLHFPGRDLSKIVVNLWGDILHVEAPADGSLPPVRRDFSIEGCSRDGSLGINRYARRGLLVVTVPKEASAQSDPAPALPPSAPQSVGGDEAIAGDDFALMVSEMHRIQREMMGMMEGFADSPMPDMPLDPPREFTGHGFQGGGMGRATFGGIPSLEDAGDRYVVRVSMPGQDLSKVNVNLRDRLLTIEVGNENSGGSGGYRTMRSFRYSQAMNLPGPVLVGKMKIDRQGDELVVTLPKLRES